MNGDGLPDDPVTEPARVARAVVSVISDSGAVLADRLTTIGHVAVPVEVVEPFDDSAVPACFGGHHAPTKWAEPRLQNPMMLPLC